MQFEPFQDRLSRDIRNDLSEMMITVLAQQDIESAQKVADKYLDSEIEQLYKGYINDRLARYRNGIEKIQPSEL